MAAMASEVVAQFSYSYKDNDGSEVAFEEGDRFTLLDKATEDWWKVKRKPSESNTGRKIIIYVPASYMKEVTSTPTPQSPNNSDSSHEYMNLDAFRAVMARSNSNTDSDYSYSDQDTQSSLGTSPRVLNGSFSPTPSPTFSSNTAELRKSLNLEALLGGGMISKQPKRGNITPSPSLEEADEDPPIGDSGATEKPTSFEKETKIYENTVVLRAKKNVDVPIGRRSSTLPAGWHKMTDDMSGRLYYYNENTKESVWKPPRASVFIENIPPQKDVPAGWMIQKDESNEDVYVNSVNDEKWKSLKTDNGQTYYYKVGEDVTVWELPEVEVQFRGARRRSLDDLTDDNAKSRMSRTFPRNSKCKSVLMDFSGNSIKLKKDMKLTSPKGSPKLLHRRSQSASMLIDANVAEVPNVRLSMVNGKSAKFPDVEGLLSRKKLVEGGKSKKGHFEQVYVCKYENILVFYKDKKSATPKPDFPDGKPESSIDLRGAVLEAPSADRTKGRKNVFQISTYNKATVMMLMADTPILMATWLTPIQLTIKKLEEADPLPAVSSAGSTDSGIELSDNTSNSLSIPKIGPPLSPTTPPTPRKDKIDKAERAFKGISRRLSSKRGSNLNDDDANKTRIKDKLKKFLPKRPTYYELEKKGIIKQEVYGCHLEVLCKREHTTVPTFVVKCIEAVEKRGLHIRGIYRECGNASLMHKLRISTDQGERIDFDDKQWADIHVIAGALKWYFRELPEPVIPAASFDEFVNGIKNPSVHERRRKFKTLISSLPTYNYDTLKYVLQHLLKVSEYSSENKMEKQNCSIVFGPTLLRPDEEDNHLNIALNTVYQNQIVNFLLSEYAEVFAPA